MFDSKSWLSSTLNLSSNLSFSTWSLHVTSPSSAQSTKFSQLSIFLPFHNSLSHVMQYMTSSIYAKYLLFDKIVVLSWVDYRYSHVSNSVTVITCPLEWKSCDNYQPQLHLIRFDFYQPSDSLYLRHWVGGTVPLHLRHWVGGTSTYKLEGYSVKMHIRYGMRWQRRVGE